MAQEACPSLDHGGKLLTQWVLRPNTHLGVSTSREGSTQRLRYQLARDIGRCPPECWRHQEGRGAHLPAHTKAPQGCSAGCHAPAISRHSALTPPQPHGHPPASNCNLPRKTQCSFSNMPSLQAPLPFRPHLLALSSDTWSGPPCRDQFSVRTKHHTTSQRADTLMGHVAQVLLVTLHPNAGFYPRPSTLCWDWGRGACPTKPHPQPGGSSHPRPTTCLHRISWQL